MLTTIRAKILRRYYSAQIHGSPITTWYQDASFEEYFELCKIMWPGVNRWTAARNSSSTGMGHFRAELENLGPEPVRQEIKGPEEVGEAVRKQNFLDLKSPELREDAQYLLLDRIKEIHSWKALSRFRQLKRVSAVLSKTADLEPAESRIPLESLDITECSPALERVLLRSSAARQLDITYSQGLDLSLVKEHVKLEEFFIGAQLARNFESLAKLPLRKLHVGRVHIDERVTQTLLKLKKTLTKLSLKSTEPFGPDVIPLAQLKKLTRLSVPAYAEHREAWLETACNNPHIYFDIPYTAAHVDEPKQKVTVAEIYRDIDILEIKKGKKTLFEVAGEMTEYAEERGFEGDNGDLEDELKERGKAAKVRGLKWSSEGDNLVVQASKLEALRWVIDAIHER